ncbi:MAG: hypothetical protein U1E51_11450 [Candidatus Binatia bacterium]|nr:hypothetical protein [Candidatus Binatia bacterium]
MNLSDPNKQTGGQQIDRFVNLHALLEKKSHFLLGPRPTGKTFLV